MLTGLVFGLAPVSHKNALQRAEVRCAARRAEEAVARELVVAEVALASFWWSAPG
jgi:hypothetical protein